MASDPKNAPFSDPGDDAWDVFLPDDESAEPDPAPGDFWIDCDEAATPHRAA